MRKVAVIVTALALAGSLGCSREDPVQNEQGQITRAGELSVFNLKVGNCAVPPTEVQTELAVINVMPCDVPHSLEVYATLTYANSGEYPGEKALRTFADANCANEFEDYVHIPYTDSSLYFTYLLPSPRSWAENTDRAIPCFITTTGKMITGSVKGQPQ